MTSLDYMVSRCADCGVWVYDMETCNICIITSWKIKDFEVCQRDPQNDTVRVTTVAPNHMGLMIEYGCYVSSQIAEHREITIKVLDAVIQAENSPFRNIGFGRWDGRK